ncbi:hypothetical protein APHAL10511_004317 [Amanita phalloides]|nr:hypothetical protein APHAL10511_004317 [Amanita phalloides]
MARIPPTLSYLTIYNPTLQSTRAIDDDDEDAEAQAHILFYTSKEKAVSRDRILRQVGLAKALVNFAEFFNNQDLCDSVHSQTRSMVMVSPEPDFWIHAGIEIAKTHRVVPDKGKGKARDKTNSTSKTNDDTVPVSEYHGGSVQDNAIRSLLLRGYEQFKLTHGSFTEVISTLGQEALELQLERFFTVWAWSLNLEEMPDFGEHLGIPLLPLHRRLVTLLDSMENDIGHALVFSQPPHVVSSSNYFIHGYPLSLLRHLPTLIPKPQPISSSSPGQTTSSLANGLEPEQAVAQQSQSANNVDTKKWHWPHYLTFGGRAPPKSNHVVTEFEKQKVKPAADAPQISDVDRSALEDAICTVGIAAPIQAENVTPPPPSDSAVEAKTDDQSEAAPEPTIEALRTFVHFSEPANLLSTRRKEIFYFIDDGCSLTIIPQEGCVVTDLATKVVTFFKEMKILTSTTPLGYIDQLPSAAKILQQTDQYVITNEGVTLSDPLFSSRSPQLYETKAALDLDCETSEVFSRGQNPQHWHVAKRDIGVTSDGTVGGEVYLEVFRKESSLADVDNVLAGVVRKNDL